MGQADSARGGRPWTFDREQAVDIAMRLFWRHGYEGVSIADLTKAIGVAPPSLYAAFGSKAGLYRHAIARYEARDTGVDVGVLTRAVSADEGVRALLEDACAAVVDPDGEPGCMISSGMITAHPAHMELARDIAARRATLRADIAQALRRFVDQPVADRGARLIVTIMQGLSVQARDGASLAALREVVDDAMTGLATSLASTSSRRA